uniref:Retrovirus-related Gag polyprotein from transposon HMS-Beagle n=1 Tax=Anoplophora glabripennis TaxID=217634 RepID=V5GJT3_ANOGL
MAQPSIRDYMDTVPPFNGDPILISNFILACENVIEILGRPDDANFNSFLVAHIRSKLVGRATQLIAVRNLKSWNELKQAILFTFGDQRDEDALMRDLIMLKQENNESSLRFGEKCQDTLSLLLSKVNSSVITEALRIEKISMYRNLAVKTFMKGLKEPYSLIVRCRNPQTLEEAINIVTEENNLNYIRKVTQAPNNRLYQWPNRPNHWQQQAGQRPITNSSFPRPQNPQQGNTPSSVQICSLIEIQSPHFITPT